MVNPFKKDRLGEYVIFSHSTIGAWHIKEGRPCQDYSCAVRGDGYLLAAVCDGHGGKDYFRSDKGSEFAAMAVRECVADKGFLSSMKKAAGDESKTEPLLLQLKKSIIYRWNCLVAEDMEASPFMEEELAGASKEAAELYAEGRQQEMAYGTTLIAAVVAEGFWFGLHIGDGRCAVLDDDGDFRFPIPWDEKCVGNRTTSICDVNALAEFRHFCGKKLPSAVIIGSDGVDGCFDDEAKLCGFYKVILRSLSESGEEEATAQLFDYLPRMSQKGSGDDISIGCIVDMSAR